MASTYAEVRRQWREIQTEQDLKAIWRGERFESSSATEDALRVYEMAIRVDGWDKVREWAQACLPQGQILNAQLVELAMRSTEHKDEDFFLEITNYLQQHSPPNYFRFWFSLFTARHSHFGERLFRQQLNELRDFTIVKYRRWLHKILRKLRFRCRSEKEKAIGAIVFGMYANYDKKAYPSDVFEAYIACHDIVRNPRKTKSAKPVSKAQQIVDFSKAASKLGIWSITEGIRTSAGLPRTIGYLAAMAPCMTDTELLRALRAFDVNLLTASHKKASDQVVKLAGYIKERLEAMELPIEEWCKIYPYLTSPALIEVFCDLIEGLVDAETQRAAQDISFSPIVCMPLNLGGRSFRIAQVASYLMFLRHQSAALFQLSQGYNQLLSHPSKLWPRGIVGAPGAQEWMPRTERRHRALFQLIQSTFPDAANRQSASTPYLNHSAIPVEEDVLRALRYRLYHRDLVDGGCSPDDVPLIFLASEPTKAVRTALETYLSMFAGAALFLFERRWERPLALEHVLHFTEPGSVDEFLGQMAQLHEALPDWQASFASRKTDIDAEIRMLRLQAAPYVQHMPI